jgi:CDP-diacylglycerol--glycerol-3-phosphate 3-phosphatidyltransferase
MLRAAMIPALLIVLYLDFTGSRYVAAAVFIIASLTDFADGYIARRRGLVTDFGKFMDPLADKLLVFAAMMWFVEKGAIPAWAALVVIARELAVTALRLVSASSGRVIAAAKSGKIKTACTMVCLTVMFFGLPAWANWICTIIITATTVISGAEQFMRNSDVLRDVKKS